MFIMFKLFFASSKQTASISVALNLRNSFMALLILHFFQCKQHILPRSTKLTDRQAVDNCFSNTAPQNFTKTMSDTESSTIEQAQNGAKNPLISSVAIGRASLASKKDVKNRVHSSHQNLRELKAHDLNAFEKLLVWWLDCWFCQR